MLSRVAEAMYWMARYIERAEDLTRLMAVNFNATLDTAGADSPAAWLPVVLMTGDETLYAEIYGEPQARTVIEFVAWHPLNPNAVTACITRARENARSVREQISSEMWEHINQLYLLVRDSDRAAVQRNPHEFFRQIRDGSQMFQGVTLATLTHNEPYEFLRLGTHLERADKTVRILDAKYRDIYQPADNSGTAALELIALLRSCSAFEPFRRAPGSVLEADRVVEYLLLSRDFPRAVLFCVNRCLQALESLGDPADMTRLDHPRRALGRLSADLEYLALPDVLGGPLDEFLEGLLHRLNAAGDAVTRTYFNTSVILPDERPRQQQQQQQQ